MIGIKFQGRMGNQMFQYAFAYTVSKQRKQSFYIDGIKKTNKLIYFHLEGKQLFNFSNFLKKHISFPKKKMEQLGNENTNDILRKSIDYNFFDGYFQSELFFKEFEAEIKKIFTIKDIYVADFDMKYKSLFNENKIIVIHIRRADYLDWDLGSEYGGLNPTLPFTYVDSVLQKFNLANYKVIFISDDITAVKGYFGEASNFLYETNSEIIDFQLLMNADVLCLSNSTFAWWGAYLNKKKNKIVYAPEYWLGFKTKKEYPVDIICESWKKIKISL